MNVILAFSGVIGVAAKKLDASIGIMASVVSSGIGAMTGIIIFCKMHMIGDLKDDNYPIHTGRYLDGNDLLEVHRQ